ncbi:MAG: imidazolonepropionase [Gemmatimonadota bacterium]
MTLQVLRNIGQLATGTAASGPSGITTLAGAALVWEAERILWLGPEADLPAEYRNGDHSDAGGGLVIPGLVDCHTHLGFGGWRGDEFAMRLAGRSYQEIAAAGGGILSTMRQTRTLGPETLVDRCLGFLAEMASLGVTTVECKTGYGLDESSELMLLEVYQQVGRRAAQRIVPTLLAAHAVPPEYQERREDYLALITERLIPEAGRRGLARFCDVFVESGAFTIDEARRILRAGQAAGLRPKLHADQLSAGGGAELAAEVGAASADHLEHISDEGIHRMAEAGVVAVSLPLATLYLNQRPLPARRLIEAGVPVAVATDFNPGSAPSFHLPLAMMLGCTLQRMTPAEVLAGATLVAAQAIGLEHEVGSLEVGKAADFAVIDAPDLNHWMYHFRGNACRRTVIAGQTVFSA